MPANGSMVKVIGGTTLCPLKERIVFSTALPLSYSVQEETLQPNSERAMNS